MSEVSARLTAPDKRIISQTKLKICEESAGITAQIRWIIS